MSSPRSGRGSATIYPLAARNEFSRPPHTCSFCWFVNSGKNSYFLAACIFKMTDAICGFFHPLLLGRQLLHPGRIGVVQRRAGFSRVVERKLVAGAVVDCSENGLEV